MRTRVRVYKDRCRRVSRKGETTRQKASIEFRLLSGINLLHQLARVLKTYECLYERQRNFPQWNAVSYQSADDRVASEKNIVENTRI